MQKSVLQMFVKTLYFLRTENKDFTTAGEVLAIEYEYLTARAGKIIPTPLTLKKDNHIQA